MRTFCLKYKINYDFKFTNLQAYLIKNMLFSEEKSAELENWRQLAGMMYIVNRS